MESPHTVFVVQHVREIGGAAEDVKFIGVYSSRALAAAAVERLGTQPGFRDAPDGFHIDAYTIDTDHWAQGFASLVGEHEVPTQPADASRPAS
jgi:hypothetical protein